jgi:hypothetical protein
MSAPLVPSPLDYIGRRRFAFYPAIRNIQPNEWVLGTGSWSEVQVVNSQTGAEIWIPRQYIGAVSETHDPVLVVGLIKELEYRAGALEPRVKRVIEMPQVGEKRPVLTDPSDSLRPSGPAPVIGIRVENRDDSPMNRALILLGVGAIVVSLLAALLSVLARP